MTATDQKNRLEKLLTRIVGSVQPSQSSVRKSVAQLRATQPQSSDLALAESWAERVCRLYAAEGALSALPAVIPGLGTSAQLVIEGGTIASDLAYMLRCMADIVIGVGQIFGQEIEYPFNEEFVRILGIWCGALSLGKEAAVRIGAKVAVAQAKRIPAEVFKRLSPHIGRDIATKIGLKRGGATFGRLVPFGVGALVGGGFNYATMRGFKNTAIDYYSAAAHNVVLCA